MGGGKQNTAFCQWKEGGRLKRRVDLWVVIYGNTSPHCHFYYTDFMFCVCYWSFIKNIHVLYIIFSLSCIVVLTCSSFTQQISRMVMTGVVSICSQSLNRTTSMNSWLQQRWQALNLLLVNSDIYNTYLGLVQQNVRIMTQAYWETQ